MQFVAPDSYTITLAISLFLGMVVGGVGWLPGSLVGAAFIIFVPNIAEGISKGLSGAVFGVLSVPRHLPGAAWREASRDRGPATAGRLRKLKRARLRTKETQCFSKQYCESPRSSTAVATLASERSALAQKKYDTGATDTEIKIGNIMPYSGPASAYGVIGKTEEAYFKMINDEGGINGRKINFITYDDGYCPPKAVEQARKLVESDEVLLVFNPLGTPSNTAIQKYLNAKKVPQLFVATGATKWNDPKDFPWTMGWQPTYQSEAQIYAKYLLKEKPNAKIAMLYQNDDFGKDYLKGLKDGLGAKALDDRRRGELRDLRADASTPTSSS